MEKKKKHIYEKLNRCTILVSNMASWGIPNGPSPGTAMSCLEAERPESFSGRLPKRDYQSASNQNCHHI